MRITAGAFAASIVTTFWDRHAAFHQSRLAEASSVYDVPLQRALDTLHGLGLSDLQSIGVLARTLARWTLMAHPMMILSVSSLYPIQFILFILFSLTDC